MKENWTSVAFPRWRRKVGNSVLGLGSEFSALSIRRRWVFKCTSCASFKISFALTLTYCSLAFPLLYASCLATMASTPPEKAIFLQSSTEKNEHLPNPTTSLPCSHTFACFMKEANITCLASFLSGKQVMGLTDSSCKYSSFCLKDVYLIVRASACYCHSYTD